MTTFSATRRRLVATAIATPIAASLGSGVSTQEATSAASPVDSPTAGTTPVSIARNKQLVAEATDAFFNQHNPSAVDHYIGSTYIQHSTVAGDGPEALRELIAGLGEDVTYEAVRLLGDGDLVAVHARATGFGEAPLVVFDIFRIADNKLVEHWDGLQAEGEPNPSGHTMLDGPTEVTRPERTETSRALVEEFVDVVLIGGQYDRLPEFISTETYIQHNPQFTDGIDGFVAAIEALAPQGITLVYNARHRTVAEGEFVLVQSDGEVSRPVVYYDLFRVEGGKIVEHWDVIQDIPAEIPHDNGLF